MTEIRQFSFQDHGFSRPNGESLDPINSNEASGDEVNINTEPMDFTTPETKEYYLDKVEDITNQNFSQKDILESNHQDEGKDMLNREYKQGFDSGSKEPNTDSSSKNNKQNGQNIEEEPKWKIELKESENHLKENWKKMDKINKMLEEHKKRKVDKNSNKPQSKNNQTKALAEISQNIERKSPQSKIKSIKKAVKLIPVSTKKLEVYEDESIDYNESEEIPEQPFSRTLIEPFTPNKPPVNNRHNQIAQTELFANEREQEEIRESAQQERNSQNYLDGFSQRLERSTMNKTDLNQNSKDGEKKLPIEERLRLKDIEREIRLTKLREERARKQMKELQSKPYISDNSINILKNSRRTRETVEVLERLSISDSKKVKGMAAQNSTLNSIQNNKSQRKDDSQRIDLTRQTEFTERSNEINSNAYRKSNFLAQVASGDEHQQYIGVHDPFIKDYDGLEVANDSRPTQSTQPRAYENLEFTETSLQGDFGEDSLQKQASDKLQQALAKKRMSHGSTISNQLQKEDALKYENTLPLSPASYNLISINGQRRETSDSYKNNPEILQDEIYGLYSHSSLQTEIEPIFPVRNPKHVYLRIPSELLEYKDDNKQAQNVSPSLINQIDKDFGLEAHRKQLQEQQQQQQPQTYDLIQGEEREYDNENAYSELKDDQSKNKVESSALLKKKSTRQPTFGGSPSKTGTEQSSKVDFNSESPALLLERASQNKISMDCLENNDENITRSTVSKDMGRPSVESLMNSWKLRQQAFSGDPNFHHGPGLRLSDLNRRNRLQIKVEDEKPWPDLDVYMRNKMWLSAKNSKIAALHDVMEQEELKECTFRPQIVDKGVSHSKSEFRGSIDGVSERSKLKFKDTGRQHRFLNSYKEIHEYKLKLLDQHEKIETKSPVKNLEQENILMTEIEEETPVELETEPMHNFQSL